jgi:uncharacterized transporter YbjL
VIEPRTLLLLLTGLYVGRAFDSEFREVGMDFEMLAAAVAAVAAGGAFSLPAG